MQNDPFGGLMGPWQNAQKPMAEVMRWGNFPTYGQTLLAHNNSIPYVLMYVQVKLQWRDGIDWLLLSQAILVHDQGEPLSGGDEHADNKTADKDVKEYLAVAELMRGADVEFRRQFMRAFLLQYVRKPQWWPHMASEDRALVTMLSEKYALEALIFEATERLDYFVSAVEGARRSIENVKETMIDHVIRNQVPKLDALVLEWGPFAHVWSPDLKSQLLCLGSR